MIFTTTAGVEITLCRSLLFNSLVYRLRSILKLCQVKSTHWHKIKLALGYFSLSFNSLSCSFYSHSHLEHVYASWKMSPILNFLRALLNSLMLLDCVLIPSILALLPTLPQFLKDNSGLFGCQLLIYLNSMAQSILWFQ